jgi:hypothetical protein
LPAAASGDSLREQNREFILENTEDYDPDETVEVRINGQWQTMKASEALDHALDMTEDTDLETIALSADEATHGEPTWVGDILHLALGGADCGTTTEVAPSTPGEDLDPQFELHDGPVAYTTGTNADRLHVVYSYTMKEGHLADELNWGGKAQSLCVPGFVALDRIDGYATEDDALELPHP